MRLGELAGHLSAELHGDPAHRITGVGTLRNATADQLTFLSNARYRQYLPGTRAAAVILGPDDLDACPVAALVSRNPYLDYARAAALLHPETAPEPGVHPSASVDADAELASGVSVGPNACIGAGARLGAGCAVGPGCVIGPGARLGADCTLVANVTVCAGVTLGDRVIVHPGAVIGADGFGIANDAGRWVKVPQLGSVTVGNDVEIGANTSIDRGALEDTVIGDGVKIDNQVQVAHNVHIGDHTAIAGCVGISGSTRVGRRCLIGGGVGLAGHLEIGDDVQLTGMTLVTKSIPGPGTFSSGIPASPHLQWQRTMVHLRRIDDLVRRVQALEKRRP